MYNVLDYSNSNLRVDPCDEEIDYNNQQFRAHTHMDIVSTCSALHDIVFIGRRHFVRMAIIGDRRLIGDEESCLEERVVSGGVAHITHGKYVATFRVARSIALHDNMRDDYNECK